MFLLKIFLNGLSLLNCLSKKCRKYLPMLMLVSLQKGGFNQTTFLFLLRLFEGLFLLLPTLTSVQDPLLLLLTLEPGSTRITYSSLPWNPLFLRVSSYILLHEDRLLIFWFTALGICLSTDL